MGLFLSSKNLIKTGNAFRGLRNAKMFLFCGCNWKLTCSQWIRALGFFLFIWYMLCVVFTQHKKNMFSYPSYHMLVLSFVEARRFLSNNTRSVSIFIERHKNPSWLHFLTYGRFSIYQSNQYPFPMEIDMMCHI